MKRTKYWLLAAAFVVTAFANKAQAVTSTQIAITVSINATKSLSINTSFYDFGALLVNTASQSATAIVVTNDSGALVETYTMTASTFAPSLGGGTQWNLSGTTNTATDQYVLSAQFSTSRPANASDSTFAADNLDGTTQVCTATVFGNGTLAQSGASVSPLVASRDRNLWFRIVTPETVSDVTQRRATVTLAVQ